MGCDHSLESSQNEDRIDVTFCVSNLLLTACQQPKAQIIAKSQKIQNVHR